MVVGMVQARISLEGHALAVGGALDRLFDRQISSVYCIVHLGPTSGCDYRVLEEL